jgi:Ca2+-binding RTX toxin-like protein
MLGDAKGGNDVLVAGNGAQVNFLYGDAYAMQDNTVGGDDRLVSGTGNDQMWGDAEDMSDNAVGGRDVFAFLFGSNGEDTIGDFEQGKDKIEIGGATGGFDGLGIEVMDGHSIIDMGDDNSITVKFVTQLMADDFLFVA